MLVGFHQKQASQELQLQYDNGSNLQAVYGLYYLRETVPSHQEAYADDLFALLGAPIGFLRTIDDDLTTNSYAGFAHVNWEFVPSWTSRRGVRYSSDSKDYDRTTSTFWVPRPPGCRRDASPSTPTSAGTRGRLRSACRSSSTQKPWCYVSASRGFKSGGFNGRANSAVETKTAKFDPEYVWTYELGLKSRSRG